MAIENKRMQQRYGTYEQFMAHQDEFLPNEIESVTSGDPNTADGKAVYYAFGPGDTKRLMTAEDAAADIAKGTEEATKAAEELRDSTQEIYDQTVEYVEGNEFVKKNQGAENAGKALVIDDAGNVVPGKSGADLDALEKIAIKPTATGTDIIAEDSADWRLLDLSAQGWTEQNYYDGKNILSNRFSDWESGDYNTSDGEKISGEFRIRTKKLFDIDFLNAYTILKNEDIELLARGYSEDGSFYANIGTLINGQTKNINSEIKKLGFVLVGKKEDINFEKWGELFNGGLEMMVRNSIFGTEYEPYTGGQPSPSPEYQQEIVNAGIYNEEKQKYEAEVNVGAPQLYDGVNERDTILNKNGETVNFEGRSTTGFIKVYQNTEYSGFTKYLRRCFFDSEKKIISYNDNGAISEKTPKNCSYVRFNFINDSVVMFNIGNSILPYEPYKTPQTVTITSDRPLTKWDKLEKRDGKWGWSYGGKKGDIPKSGYSKSIGSKENVYFRKENVFNDIVFTGGIPTNDNQFCNTFLIKNPYGMIGNYACVYKSSEVSNAELRISLENQDINTAELFEQYIADKDIYFYYQLKTPEFVELSPEEQDALNALTTYYPTTVIQNDSGMEMTVKYVADPENYLKKNYQEKLEQIDTLAGQVATLQEYIIKEV